MGANAIELSQVSKRYFLGEHLGTGRNLREAVSAFINRRGARPPVDEVWSLRYVTLEIGEGDVVGIIGRNGAGKSTLLKIITRITEPTSGVSRTRGRVGALLEVGTGFHPELTGRENVFLNGAILGMPRRQVQKQFDEIVAFVGRRAVHRHPREAVLVRHVPPAGVRGRGPPRRRDHGGRRGAGRRGR